jgi:diguanylate cyclase (GGDEF)-like protein
MNFSLGLDLHDMNRALASTSENLKRQIVVHEKTEEYIRQLGFQDSLTGLHNRAKLDEQLGFVLRQESGVKQGALIILGLDDFKAINNVLGHDVGDAILQLVAQRLGRLELQGGLLTRFSGDEFIFLFPDLGFDTRHPDVVARDLAKRSLDILSPPFEFDDRTVEVGACAGISIFSCPSTGEEKPLQCAELALNRAKSLGRGSIQLYEAGMQAELAERLQLERDMRKGLTRNEFHVYYQPQLDLRGNVIGAEALSRWRHPEKGFISPAIFIPIAEKSGLIHQLGEWVLRQACQQIEQWALCMPAFKGHIAVNVSNWQVNRRGYEKCVQQILSDSGVNASRLILEITESLFINDLNDAITRIHALRSLGLRFSIDDFGTGYASLSYLRYLPVDELKIDKSFVKNLGTDERDTHLVETIVSIAKHMSMQVVAEGVENEVQRTALTKMNVTALQGYHLAAPMDKDEFQTWLTERYKSQFSV